jgi:hypothetical protein
MPALPAVSAGNDFAFENIHAPHHFLLKLPWNVRPITGNRLPVRTAPPLGIYEVPEATDVPNRLNHQGPFDPASWQH